MKDHEAKTIDDLLNSYRKRIRQLEKDKKNLKGEIEELENTLRENGFEKEED